MWSAVVLCDGEPVTGQVPVDDWTAAGIVAEFFARWLGGPISLAQAVVANQPSTEDPTLFDRAEDWFIGPRIDRGEVERNARACKARTGTPQRIHPHPHGHLCTSVCRVLDEEG